jgi:type IV pilus assembly protein PilW
MHDSAHLECAHPGSISVVKMSLFSGSAKVSLNRQKGINLVELMITLTISLGVLGGASVILVNTNKSSRLQGDLVNMQSNARIAMQQIASDIQKTGYYGCVKDINPFDPAGPIISKLINNNEFLDAPVQGLEHPTGFLTGNSRDVMELQFVLPVTELATDMSSPTSSIEVMDVSSISVGDILLIANCETGDIFSVSGITGNNLDHQANGSSGNDVNSLSTWYRRMSYINYPTEVFRFSRVKYYIDDLDNIPTLFRAVNVGDSNTRGTPQAHAFVRGVEAFEVLYGEDTDGDVAPDGFFSADNVTNWRNISAIRYALLIRTEDEYGTDVDRSHQQGDSIDVLGASFAVGPERVRRRIFKSTVYLRNSI